LIGLNETDKSIFLYFNTKLEMAQEGKREKRSFSFVEADLLGGKISM